MKYNCKKNSGQNIKKEFFLKHLNCFLDCFHIVLCISIFTGCGLLNNRQDAQLPHMASAEEENMTKQFKIPTGKALIYLIQEKHYDALNGEAIDVYLDAKPFRVLAPATYCVAEIEPGQHAIQVKSSDAFTFGNKTARVGKDTYLQAKPDQAYFFETKIMKNSQNFVLGPVVSIGSAGIIELNRMKEEAARDLLKSYRLSASYPADP